MSQEKGLLENGDFSYRVNKDGKVFLSWNHREVMILKDEKAKTFLAKIDGLSEMDRQLYMAKLTGNFKRGNERVMKNSPKK